MELVVKRDENMCKLCLKVFPTKKELSRHKSNKKKFACIPQARCLEILQENEHLKELVLHLEKCDVKREIKEIKETIDNLGEKIDEKELGTSILNQTINNVNQVNDQKMLIAINFTEKGKESLNHLSDEQTLEILNQPKFGTSLIHMTTAVLFNPLAPQNIKWCVVDQNAQFGALEYNYESNTVSRKSAKDVIDSAMEHMLDPVTEYLINFQKKNKLNTIQNKNCNDFINLPGNDLTPQQFATIKELAYNKRHFTKALWNEYNIAVEALPKLVPHIRSRTQK